MSSFKHTCQFFMELIVADHFGNTVVDNSKIVETMDRAKSQDKTLKRYAALHGLLCEPAPLIHEIENDLLQWMLQRCSSST